MHTRLAVPLLAVLAGSTASFAAVPGDRFIPQAGYHGDLSLVSSANLRSNPAKAPTPTGSGTASADRKNSNQLTTALRNVVLTNVATAEAKLAEAKARLEQVQAEYDAAVARKEMVERALPTLFQNPATSPTPKP